MHAAPLQASIHFWISPYPRLDRAVSGRNQVTKGTFIPLPSPCGCGISVSLGVRTVKPLPSPLRCTPWPVIRNERQNALAPCLNITIRFPALLTPCYGFFSTFPHGTRFAIGLGTYLRLEVDASQIHATYPSDGTQEPAQPFQIYSTGLSPSMAFLSRKL